MHHNENMKILEAKSDFNFLAASISLVASSVLANIAEVFNRRAENTDIVSSELIMFMICSFVMIVASLFTFIMTIKGFGKLKNACMLNDKNENYYLGRNLQRLAVATLPVTVILTLVVSFVAMFSAQYASVNDITAADYNAYSNLLVTAAIISIVMQIFDITLPYMIYLWKIYKSSADNFALLTVIIMVTQIIIAALNSIYTARGSDNSFLASFTIVLDVVEGLALMIFFMRKIRKNRISDADVKKVII